MFKLCLQRRANIQYPRFTPAGKQRAPKRYLLDSEILFDMVDEIICADVEIEPPAAAGLG